MTSRWERHNTAGNIWEMIRGKDCEISLEKRPAYCDRGNYQAKLHVLNGQNLFIDSADGWDAGRYYFDHAVAKSEVEAWLKKRKQWLEDTP